MLKARTVVAELLDDLSPLDPAALRSRRDLRRLHRAMGSRAILLRGLRGMVKARAGAQPLRLLELGAGDGSLMLGAARSLAGGWPPVELTLLDAQPLLDPATIADYAQLGWSALPLVSDVFDWAASATDGSAASRNARRWDLILCNLFLHHFEAPQLRLLLGAVAARGDRFFACEPRRDWLALTGSRLVGALGAGPVTRVDAVRSVQAGFRGQELSALWPATAAGCRMQEYSAGLFSHCFRTQRIGAD